MSLQNLKRTLFFMSILTICNCQADIEKNSRISQDSELKKGSEVLDGDPASQDLAGFEEEGQACSSGTDPESGGEMLLTTCSSPPSTCQATGIVAFKYLSTTPSKCEGRTKADCHGKVKHHFKETWQCISCKGSSSYAERTTEGTCFWHVNPGNGSNYIPTGCETLGDTRPPGSISLINKKRCCEEGRSPCPYN